MKLASLHRRRCVSNRSYAPVAALLVLVALAGLTLTPTAGATPATTSDLLLPYFEVQLDGAGVTTLFAVVNTSAEAVPVVVQVYTNWGIEVLEVPLVIEARAVRSVNLRDWLGGGLLPEGIEITADELTHIQSALCGEASPRDGMFYGSTPDFGSLSVAPVARLATGYVTVRAQPRSRDVLVGDYFVVDPNEDFSQGERMVDLDFARTCGSGLCQRHALRFLDGGAFDGGTELVIWTSRRAAPAASPLQLDTVPVRFAARAFEEDGRAIAEHELGLVPLQVVRVSDLALGSAFGWLDLELPDDSYVGVRYTADNRFSALMSASCLPPEEFPGPGLRLVKLTNGHDADQAPGPKLEPGAPVTWEYRVTNTGQVPLTDLVVSDDDSALTVVCPSSALQPGDSMVCTAEGTADRMCGYRNLGTAEALAGDGAAVRAVDASHYFASRPTALMVELSIDGSPADEHPGVPMEVGAPFEWIYEVTNQGETALTGVSVHDAEGAAVACPRNELSPGESMTCRVADVAREGGGRGQATARGSAECAEAEAVDAAWYHCGPCVEEAPGIALEKATNGHDADAGPGPEIAPGTPVTWTYVVTNNGGSELHGIAVSDDDPSLTVTCPASVLAPGAAMTCTAVGTAGDGPYVNLGQASGTSRCGLPVTAGDLSHYHNTPPECVEPPVALSLEKATNGHDADAGPGPEIAPGSPVTWTYVVTNTGDGDLDGVVVSDDDPSLSVSCPKSSLAAGEAMTCTAAGTAGEGAYTNLGIASAAGECGTPVVAEDRSHYFNEDDPPTGDQGCTPGYWKNHADSWPATGWATGQSVASVFPAASGYAGIGSASLIEALGFAGGPGVDGAARNLLRAAVAGLLDASHPGVAYPRAAAGLIADVDAALASGDRDGMLGLAAGIDADNNLGCPLN